MLLSETFTPKAKRIFRFVAIRQGLPCSILARVNVDIFDFLANSVLPIMKDSLISFKEFVSIILPKTCFELSPHLDRVKFDLFTYDIGMQKYKFKPKKGISILECPFYSEHKIKSQ